MNENRVFHQIKTLERIVFRKFILGNEIQEENLGSIPKPTLTQMDILMYILEHKDEEIYQKNLEEVLNLRRATVSGVLQTMEKNGLIERITDTQDSRTKKIILNEKTKAIFEQNKTKFNNIEEKLTQGIPKEKLSIFLEVIEMMKNNVERENIKNNT